MSMEAKPRRRKSIDRSAPSVAEPRPFFPHIDPLSQVLEGIRLRFMVPGAHEMTAPWGVRFGVMKPADFRKHAESLGLALPPFDLPKIRGAIMAMIRGSCWLEVEKYGLKLALAGGDLVLLTRDAPITLRSEMRTPVKEIHELVRREDVEQHRGVRFGGGGAASSFLFGGFHFDDDADNPLLSSLPPLIHVKGAESDAVPWLEGNVRFLSHELVNRAPGSQSVINHLAHALFIQAVRAHALSLPADASGSWLNAVLDPELATALGLMHLRPQEPWTVASLAEHSNASRSAFSARFTAALGRPPLQYLTECRMRNAKLMLRDTTLGVKSISMKVGYANESAFGTAFKRATGLSPGAYRASVATDATRG
jgi:AraC-like DNA-binding protein